MQDHFIAQALDIDGFLPQLRHQAKRARRILPCHGTGQIKQVAFISHARHTAHNVRIHLVRHACACIQNGKRVAHRPVGQPRDQPGGIRRQFDFLLPGHIQQTALDILRRNAGEIIALASGQNRRGHLVDLRGGQNKNNVAGRFLHYFEQRIERRCGEHVHLVDNIYFVCADTGRVSRFIPQIPDIVHAIVGCGVDFHNVHHTAIVNTRTYRALSARVCTIPALTVHCFGEYLGAGRFTGAARACKNVGMSYFVVQYLVLQRRGNARLAHNVLKCCRTPFTVKRTVHIHGLLLKMRQKTGQDAALNARYTARHTEDRLPAAHKAGHLMLLGSPPDMVHGAPSHRARPLYAEQYKPSPCPVVL